MLALIFFLHRSFEIPFHIPLRDGPPLVINPLSLGQRDFDLSNAAIIEIELERYQSEALFLDFSDKPLDFLFFNQQFPIPPGLEIPIGGMRIRTDVETVEDEFTIPDRSIGIA